MLFESKVRYFYWEFDCFSIPKGSRIYFHSIIFSHDSFCTRWSFYSWSLGRLWVVTFITRVSVKTRMAAKLLVAVVFLWLSCCVLVTFSENIDKGLFSIKWYLRRVEFNINFQKNWRSSFPAWQITWPWRLVRVTLFCCWFLLLIQLNNIGLSSNLLFLVNCWIGLLCLCPKVGGLEFLFGTN